VWRDVLTTTDKQKACDLHHALSDAGRLLELPVTGKAAENGSWHRDCFEIEFIARSHSITKRQAAELMKKFGSDYATIAREARWLRD